MTTQTGKTPPAPGEYDPHGDIKKIVGILAALAIFIICLLYTSSPLVTNDLLFAGHITATGKPYTYNAFGGPTWSPVMPSGILLALDKNTGDILWQANVGAQVDVYKRQRRPW